MRRMAWVMGVLLITACGREPSPPPGPPVHEVAVRELRAESGAHHERLVGRVSAQRSAEVRARVAGILLERTYSEGSDVTEGALLFRIDPAPLAAELRAREAELARARARAANARARAERLQGLSGRGVVAAQDLEDALASRREAAAAELEAVAQVEKARLQLSYADVRAPIAGRAGKARVTEGALVGEREATPLTIVEQIDSLYIDFQVSVAAWELLRDMQAQGALPPLALRTPSGREYAHPAEVQFADLAVDARTGTIGLRAIVANPDGELLPGMFVGIDVEVGNGALVYRLPQTAVLRDAQGAYVYLLGDDGSVERRNVVPDGSADGDWLVRDGLRDGERLIVDGLQRLRPGAKARAVGGES